MIETQQTWAWNILTLLEVSEDGEDKAEQQSHEDPAHDLHGGLVQDSEVLKLQSDVVIKETAVLKLNYLEAESAAAMLEICWTRFGLVRQ